MNIIRILAYLFFYHRCILGKVSESCCFNLYWITSTAATVKDAALRAPVTLWGMLPFSVRNKLDTSPTVPAKAKAPWGKLNPENPPLRTIPKVVLVTASAAVV